MFVEVRGFLQFLEIFGEKSVIVELTDDINISNCIDELDSIYNGSLKPLIFTDGQTQSMWVRIMLNGRDIRFLQGNNRIVHENDIILFMPALAGG